jgi:hypothetical protein
VWGLTEPEPEAIQVMDRHDPEREPAEFLLPRHPVGNAAHVNGGEHRFPQATGLKQGFGGANALVVPHVLIHGEGDPGGLARANSGDRLAVIHSQWFLGEDALHRASFAGGEDER